jgi:hypothetical protein
LPSDMPGNHHIRHLRNRPRDDVGQHVRHSGQQDAQDHVSFWTLNACKAFRRGKWSPRSS